MSAGVFITADTHFGHAGALARFDRPWSDVEAMEDGLVAAINREVGADDLLYHLGDFVGPVPEGVSKTELAERVRARIDCRRIVLLRGNHDPVGKPRFDRLFESVHDLLSFRGWEGPGGGGDHRIVLGHYPLRVWQGRPGGALHLHGHTHGTLEEQGRATDVGVDCWGYRPRPLGEVLAMLAARPVDHPERASRLQPDRD